MNCPEKDKKIIELCATEDDPVANVSPLDKEDMVRLIRLVLEGLEVALHLCNTFLTKFGPSRLMDVLEQILPTAYIINTSYWPLYRTETEQSICVCNIFDINCPHISDGLSWIDLDQALNEMITCKDGTGRVTLVDLNISIIKHIVKKHYLDSSGHERYKSQKVYEIHLDFTPKTCLVDAVDEYGDPIKCMLRYSS